MENPNQENPNQEKLIEMIKGGDAHIASVLKTLSVGDEADNIEVGLSLWGNDDQVAFLLAHILIKHQRLVPKIRMLLLQDMIREDEDKAEIVSDHVSRNQREEDR